MKYFAAFGALALVSAASVNASPLNIYWDGTGNPTTLDSNGDGFNDWVIRGPGTYNNNTSLDGSAAGGTVWNGGHYLDTRPLFNFANPFVVDMRWKAASGGGDFDALFWVNINRGPTEFSPVYMSMINDGTDQTLNVYSKSGSNGPAVLLQAYTGLSLDFQTTKFDFDTVNKSLVVSINGVAQTALTYLAGSPTNDDAFATIGGGKMILDYYGQGPLAVVPLPPAAWAGLATLAGVAGCRRLRRRG